MTPGPGEDSTEDSGTGERDSGRREVTTGDGDGTQRSGDGTERRGDRQDRSHRKGDTDPPQNGRRTGESKASGRRLNRRRILRHAIVLGLAVTLAVAPLALISGAVVPGDAPPARQGTLEQPGCTSDTETTPEPSVQATVERVEDAPQVRVTYDFSGPEAPNRFAVSMAQLDLDVVESPGFEKAGIESGTYEWTGEENPSLTYTVPERDVGTSLAEESPRFNVGEDWALAPLPRTIEETVEYNPAPNGVVSPTESGIRVAYIGTLRTANASQGCQTISIHTPPDSEVDGETLSNAVADAAAEYPAGQRPAHVEGVVVPLRGAIGGYTVGSFFTVNPTSNLSTETIAVHEYVHTRQSAEYESEMQWFVEGQPALYMFKLRYDAGQLTAAEYSLQMHTFRDRAEWDGSFQPETNINHYYRGASTLGALDVRIRVATDGERSLIDVIQRLERREGEVGVAEFKTTVENTTGQSMDPWIDRHVVEGKPVDAAVPDNGTLSRGSWEMLTAYQYLTEATPAAVVFYTVIWYGLLLVVGRILGGLAHSLRNVR